MRILALALALPWAGCTASADAELPDPAVGGPGLHGSPPAQALALPDVAVVDQHGQDRGPEDLKGRPHVLWFFPMAGTPG